MNYVMTKIKSNDSIAIDSSSLIAFLGGEGGPDIEKIKIASMNGSLVLPPVVLSEMLSDSKMPEKIRKNLLGIPLLEIKEGFWERAGILRSRLIDNGLKARLADTLIAQICIEHQSPLITRDSDFKHFVKFGGLKLWVNLACCSP